jgi:hypothetical protein
MNDQRKKREHQPDTSSSSRTAAESSTHFTCRPATRPDWLADELLDPRLLGLPDLLGRALMARLRACPGKSWSNITSTEAREILVSWAAQDFEQALRTVDRQAIRDLSKRHRDLARYWNHWLLGQPEDPRHLLTLCWCLGLHPRTIGAVERLIKRT